ncbi:serine/threonine dehydratase [Brumicola blandensis]|uniref:Serine/threonine dehydratase n=1 Tax=Brumicola blandensis TaxID=3075611 RepID=A0AAW8R8D5_9ALTE|nr:serine/threonine dehydratase [Alteromonas sp. W409]MDT0584185.1 serine/threonine dehydratase [Alteromonas sp. W409]
MINIADITAAQERISKVVKTTPIFQSRLLNHWLGHEIYFKAECLQRTGAFKLRGAMNVLAKCHERQVLPKKVVANSSGNHAQAVAFAAAQFGIPAHIYCANTISPIKAAATEFYGAQVHQFDTRIEADQAVEAAGKEDGCLWIPPFNHPDIIAGQGTVTLEALQQLEEMNVQPNGVFAPCGGGGLLSGAIVTVRDMIKAGKLDAVEVVGAEPLNANDAARSLQSGFIEVLDGPPDTLADGAATPSVGPHTFEILQSVDDFYEVDEIQIAYWTQWLHHLLKLHIEPTCAMTMAAVAAWIADKPKNQKILVLLSGGNISQASMSKIWQTDYLLQPPIINPDAM